MELQRKSTDDLSSVSSYGSFHSFEDESFEEMGFQEPKKIRNPEVIKSSKLIERTFGLDAGTVDTEGGLAKGQALLNREFSSWDLAKNQVDQDSWFATVKTFFVYLWSGNDLVKEAKANQELLKNPTSITQAVTFLAELRDKDITVDFDQFHNNGLDKANGPELGLLTVRSEEQALDRLVSGLPKGVKYDGETISQRMQALLQFEQALQAVIHLASDTDEAERFEVQQQLLAAVTHNVAQTAGFSDNSREMDVLVDQMGGLWLKTPGTDKKTPIAIEHLADKLAAEFDPTNKLDALYLDVSDKALLLAQARLTDLENPDDISEEVTKLQAKFEVMIWDALKTKEPFQHKMMDAVNALNDQIDALHNLRTTTKTVADEVVSHFDAIAKEDLAKLDGEHHFSTFANIKSGVPDQIFGLLQAYKGTYDEGAKAWDKMPAMDFLYFTEQLTEVDLKLTLAAEGNSSDDGAVDVFGVVKELVGDARIGAEKQRLQALTGNSDISNEEAAHSLFKQYQFYANGIIPHYEKALTYFREATRPLEVANEFQRPQSAGGPTRKAVDHYDQEAKQAELNDLKMRLQELALLAAQGTGGPSDSEDTAEMLRLIRSPEGLPKEAGEFLFGKESVKAFNIVNPKDIDDSALRSTPFNLEASDYYNMLAKGLGLSETGLHGSATLTAEIIEFLEYANDDIDGDQLAVMLLLTKGRFSIQELSDLYNESKDLKEVIDEMADQLFKAYKPTNIQLELPKLAQPMRIQEFKKQERGEFNAMLLRKQGVVNGEIKKLHQPSYLLDTNNLERLVKVAKGEENIIARELVEKMGVGSAQKAAVTNSIASELKLLQDPRKRDEAFDTIKEILRTSSIPDSALPVGSSLTLEGLQERLETEKVSIEEDEDLSFVEARSFSLENLEARIRGAERLQDLAFDLIDESNAWPSDEKDLTQEDRLKLDAVRRKLEEINGLISKKDTDLSKLHHFFQLNILLGRAVESEEDDTLTLGLIQHRINTEKDLGKIAQSLMGEYNLFEGEVGKKFTANDKRVFDQIVSLLNGIQKNENAQLNFDQLKKVLEADEISTEESSDEDLSADWLLEQIGKKDQEAVAESLAQMKFGVKTLTEEHDDFVEQISLALTAMRLPGKKEEGFQQVKRLLYS